MRDLVILVPCKCTEFTVRGALPRSEALGIRPVTFTVIVDQGRDGGVRSRGVQLLSMRRREFSHAMMVFDYEGCGSKREPLELEQELDKALSVQWGGCGKAIVVQPEIDVWLWGAEPHLREVVDWSRQDGIRDWLFKRGFAFDKMSKPIRPKEALEAIFLECGLPRSASIYAEVSARLSLGRCSDAAFGRLRGQLRDWFPANQDEALAGLLDADAPV